MIKLNYINRIKANISIYSNKKTTNILDGTYKSIFKGKSMNFENLREYVINDDVKDIDWKSSARSRSPLVKQYIAEKKHNILLVMDSGIKMDADTDKLENKKELALFSAGTIGYIAIKNNDYVGMIYQGKKIEFKPFKYNLYNLEEYLNNYKKQATTKENNINDILNYIAKNITKKSIIFIITDLDGINKIEEQTLKRLRQNNDISIININDNLMTGENLFDVSDNEYIPEMFLKDKKLNELEQKLKYQLFKDNETKLKKNNINHTSISTIKELNIKIIELLEGNRYARNK